MKAPRLCLDRDHGAALHPSPFRENEICGGLYPCPSVCPYLCRSLLFFLALYSMIYFYPCGHDTYRGLYSLIYFDPADREIDHDHGSDRVAPDRVGPNPYPDDYLGLSLETLVFHELQALAWNLPSH